MKVKVIPNSDKYREGHDRIWGKKKEVAVTLNNSTEIKAHEWEEVLTKVVRTMLGEENENN